MARPIVVDSFTCLYFLFQNTIKTSENPRCSENPGSVSRKQTSEQGVQHEDFKFISATLIGIYTNLFVDCYKFFKIPKYTGRKFVKPFSRNVGRRTGKNIKVGKNIRVNKDGFEEFDDYMSESDADMTREHLLMRSIREESQSSEESGKENAASKANIIVSQSVPNQSTFYNSTVSLSQQSQDGKVSNRSRFAWLRNRNIGRRTGKDVRGNKQIRRDEDGFEVFDDYLSPPSGAESFLSVSSVQSQSAKDKRRRSGLAEEKNSHCTEPDSPSRELRETSFGHDSHSNQKSEIEEQEVDQTLLQTNQHKLSQKLLSKSYNRSAESPHLCSSRENKVQSKLIRQPDNQFRQTLDSQPVQTESDSESNADIAENEDSASEEESDSGYNHAKSNERISEKNKISSNDNTAQRVTPAITNKSVEKISAPNFHKRKSGVYDTLDRKSERLKDGYEHDANSDEYDYESENSDSQSEDENQNQELGRDKQTKHHQNTDEQNEYSEGDSEVESDENSETENLVNATDSQNNIQQNDCTGVDNHDYGSEAESDHVMKINQSRKSAANERQEQTAGQSSKKTEKSNHESHSEADSDIEETTDKVTRTERNTSNKNHSSGSHRSVRESNNSESVAVLEENYDDDEDEELGPSSQNGIDVAGNRSGSITKLDVPDTSKVSFNRTRKRLSYSALELSEETKKARKSRVKAANQSLQEKSSRSETDRLSLSDRGYSREILKQADKTLSYNSKSAGKNTDGGYRNAVACNEPGLTSNKNEIIGNKAVGARSRIESGRTRAVIGEEYYEPSEFVCLASVARRRSTFVSNKDVDSDDDIEIFDDRKRKSVFGKNAKSIVNKKEQIDKKADKKNKRTVKSNRNIKSGSDEDENSEGSDAKQTSYNDERQMTETSKPRKAQKRLKHDVGANEKSNTKKRSVTKMKRISLTDNHDSEIEIIDDVPKKKQSRKDTIESGYDPYDFHPDNDTDNEELYIEDHHETDKKISNNKESKTVKSGIKQAKKTVIEKDGSEIVSNVNKSKNKKRTKPKSAVTQNSDENGELNNNNNLNEINEKKTTEKNMNKKKTSAKKVSNDIVETDDQTTKSAKNLRGKTKKIIDSKARTVGKTVSATVKEANSRKTRSYRSLGSQSITRNFKLKTLSSVSSLKSNKRKTVNEKQRLENDVDNLGSDPKKNKLDDSDTDSQHSAKRKLEFNKKTKSARNVKRKSKVAANNNVEVGDALSPEIESPANHCISTPAADSIHTAPTNFSSGISFRVSRRSELLDNIKSGYGNVPNITVEMQPTEGLTPCITKGDRSRKSKGRRVSILVQKDGKSRYSKQSLGLGNILHKEAVKNNRKSRNSSVGTPLPSVSSSPQHYCEVTHTRTPHPGRKSLDMLADRLIIPEPAPEGLRRSKRTRLKPIASYKNERIVYDRRRSDGWVIVGVKPSLEVKWGKVEEEKRRRRQLLNQIRKAMKKDSTGKQDRKLSVHVKLPEDAHPTTANEITVVNPDTEEELLMDCIATKDSRSPVGPDHGTPKKDDPYLIKQLIDQPIMSSGHLILKPGEEKPPQIVNNHAVTFMIHYGKLLVTIHNTTTLLETGDTFFVPYGSSYSIQNLRHDTATLFYVVLKRCEINDTVSSRTAAR